ncbi:MAG: histidine kinase [Actinomycetaceae bacterium]|nr:histidine kinase [Actinomycetaceae bacterium]
MPRKYSSSAVLAVTAALATVLVTMSTNGTGEARAEPRPGAVIVVSLCILLTSVLAIVLVRRDRARYWAALRAKEVERALAAERLAIARDLHDIVSHGLGLMTMRASVAALVNGEDAGALRLALRDVEAISRSTTLEMRRMVRVLRGDAAADAARGGDAASLADVASLGNLETPAGSASAGGAAARKGMAFPGDSASAGDVALGGDAAPLGPLPGIESIGELVERARASGLDVTFVGEGVAANSGGVAVTAYRIVQEALGNSARHAGPGRVAVSLSREEGTLVVSVDDDGGSRRPAGGWPPGAGTDPAATGGNGLAGLRERVAALAGELDYGPRAEGFFVEARIPDPGSAALDGEGEVSR